MFFGWLKRFSPRGLYGRAALILLVPILTLLALVSVVFIQRHFEDVTRQMTRNLAFDLKFILAQFEEAPSLAEAGQRASELGQPLHIDVVPAAFDTPQSDRVRRIDPSGRQVIETLRQHIPGVIAVDVRSNRRLVTLWVDTDFGPARLAFSRERVSAANPHQFLIVIAFVGVVMTLISFIFLRNQLRPIRRLAQAAEAFGRGRNEYYRPAGALEVRSAGQAFLDMRNRIERQIEQRTMMLSGVSHDLRTPLTRLKLELSMLAEEADTGPLMRDVEDMERLVDEFLAFARGDALDDPDRTDLVALVDGVIGRTPGASEKTNVTVTGGARPLTIRPLAIERALGNLLRNALRYGQRIAVEIRYLTGSVVLSVEDDGPGIPEADRVEALKPFVRLDEARNQDRGSGVGLGLSIAHDIARRHGGTLRLGQGEKLGGLLAEIVLPE